MAPGPAGKPARALPPRRWHAHPAGEPFARAAAQFVLDTAMRASLARGIFRIVLAGGATPRPVYECLRECVADWPAWHVYFGDERCVPVDHPDRNSRMALDAVLSHVPVERAHIYAIPAEHGARAAALEYAAVLKGVPDFDLVLLGLGEDGHTASLFPGADCGDAVNSPNVLPVYGAPMPVSERVSLSAARLNRSRRALFIVSGESKREAVARWRHGVDIPAAHIAPAEGVDIIIEDVLLAG
jgi:6-phosphogluconolactonase